MHFSDYVAQFILWDCPKIYIIILQVVLGTISYFLNRTATTEEWHLFLGSFLVGLVSYFIIAGCATIWLDYWYFPNLESTSEVLKNINDLSLPDTELENIEKEKPLDENEKARKAFIRKFIIGFLIMYAFAHIK
jgi:hypothetical protein